MCASRGIFAKYFSEITVEPVLFLYMLSTFSQYALFQDLVYSKVCWTRFSVDSNVCQNLHKEEYKEQLEIVQRLSSHWILMSTISLVIPSILIAMYLGSWSDRFGRKWPVVFPPLGGVCACLVYIVISVRDDVPVDWICLASLLSGLSGGFVSCIMSCMTYVASVTSEANRTVRISRLEAMTFFGGTVGPFISGSMLEITGHAYAFFYMMLCYALAFFYALLFVKDITSDGIIIQNDANVVGEGQNRSERCRNKSSDTIPSSVVATTLSTSSGGEDLEQKEGLLSASDLHVIEAIDVTTRCAVGDDDSQNCMSSCKNGGNCFVDFSLPDVAQSASISHVINQHKGDGEMQEKQCEGEDSTIIAVVATNHHHHPHHGHPHHLQNNRNSMGSSGRNSSLHGHDDGSSAASDDDQRNILRSRRHSSTLGDDEREAESSCCLKYFGTAHCLSAVKTVVKKRENGKRTYLILSLLAGFMFMVITAGEMDVAYLFARAEPLKWNYQTYSYYFGFKYGFGAFVLVLAMPLFQRMGVEDSTLAILGIISRMAALVIYGLSVNTYMAFSVPLVAVFSVFTIPATRSLLSKLVNQDEQGKMFAFVAMMEDLCTLSASLIFNSIYPLTRPIMQGLIFLLAAATLFIPIILMGYVRWKTLKFQSEESSRLSKAHLHSVEATDPAALLCIPKDFEVGK
ncbi:Proton-coupled folate transporter [Orchesella cincta]|uniref:Proton-coupled folate transporter n=1 Tax=Orchesella cincta TaxID=48709 RepID=A0A1D2MHC0_ORCCI|nr:Proton-coupled folate transporter [Orchesella cincta]